MLKNQNFLKIRQQHLLSNKKLVNLPSAALKEIRLALQQDSLFLLQHNIMDYSLYLTIERVGTFKAEDEDEAVCDFELIFNNRNVYLSDDGQYIY